MTAADYDLLVIGAGINGAGIARDAAGRGLSVLLCEKGDLAEGTSSRSGKLIHGGLRYLEYYEFRLVREALKEREVLLRAAPHIVWPMRFVLPQGGGQRPAWLLRLGLFLYDHLGGRGALPGCRSLDLRRDPEGAPIQRRWRRAFEYSDCWVEDARLVVLNARDAADRGAEVLPRTTCVAGRRQGGLWRVELQGQDGGRRSVTARSLVNAAGPWVDQVLGRTLGRTPGGEARSRVRLVRGSHIVVRKHYAGSQAYLVQNHDRRVIFVNPYEGDYLLIGTTDIAHEAGPDRVEASAEEIAYLCAAVNRWFERQIGPEDVVQVFSGVRPLYDDARENPSAVTRDYVFDLDAPEGEAPLLSIFGGKITTYRKLAEAALQRLRPFHPAMGPAWTDAAPLPGGDLPGADFEAFLAGLRRARPWLPETLARRLARAYGTEVERLLGGAERLADLGRDFGAGLSEREVAYLREREWAVTAEDVLWRRSKLGLHLSPAERAAFADWMQAGGDVRQRAG